ncbi:Transcriptional regulator MraZ [Trichinella spiralis]|uniref:Transcriptional regulator MraZ n=1 Tax=Trichinella spiralis TaxID=6334 RepID=A0ABR3KGR6_TRISP
MRKGHFMEKKWFSYGNLYNNIFHKQKDEILLSAVNKCRTSLEIKTHGVISVPLTVKLHNCMTKSCSWNTI